MIFHSYVELPGGNELKCLHFMARPHIGWLYHVTLTSPMIKTFSTMNSTKVETWTTEPTEPPLNPLFFLGHETFSRTNLATLGGDVMFTHKKWDAPRLATPGWSWKLVLFFHVTPNTEKEFIGCPWNCICSVRGFRFQFSKDRTLANRHAERRGTHRILVVLARAVTEKGFEISVGYRLKAVWYFN